MKKPICPSCEKQQAHRGDEPFDDELKRERDKYRSALERIEEIFVDGDHTYDDRENMGKIARDILEDPNPTK